MKQLYTLMEISHQSSRVLDYNKQLSMFLLSHQYFVNINGDEVKPFHKSSNKTSKRINIPFLGCQMTFFIEFILLMSLWDRNKHNSKHKLPDAKVYGKHAAQ